ncbi:MAG: hypothetical protein ABIF77_03165 [bacterium]
MHITNTALPTSDQNKQKLRLRRFSMATSTYVGVGVATGLVTMIGLGKMTDAQWLCFIGIGLLGNLLFFCLFVTNLNLRFPDPSLTREQIIYATLWGLVPLHTLPEARPIVLMFFLPAFSFGMLRLNLRQYLGLVGCIMGLYAGLLLYEYLTDKAAFRLRYELFVFVIFGMLLTWLSIFGRFVSRLRRNLWERNREIQQAHATLVNEVEERKRAQEVKDEVIVELTGAQAQVKTLSGLIPICSSCKKIRDDKGFWNQIESYIHDHSEVQFSHGICPDCAAELYPEYDLQDDPD